MSNVTDRLKDAAREVIRVPLRFPLPLLCAVLWSALMIDGRNSELYTRAFHSQAVLYLPVALFATLAVKLAAESRGWRFFIWLPASFAALGLVALHPWVALGGNVSAATPQWWLLMPAVLLAAMAAPFVGRGVDDRAAWHFLSTSLWRTGLALCVALVAALGLWGLQAGVETLFWEPDWPIKNRISTIIWSGCFGIGAAWIALAGIPRSLDTAPEGDPPREARWLVAGLLVPLGTAYLVLIYAFAGWTLIQLQLPEGKVGWLIAGFAAFGVSVWVASWPWQDSGNKLVRLWWRLFPPLLLVPVVLLAIAVLVRVGDYGITEARYGLLLLTVWLAGLAAYGSMTRPPRLMVAPASLAVLLLLACFGPWGAGPVATRSQLSELKSLLTAHDTLPGSVDLAKNPERLDQVKERIRDVAKYLSDDLREPTYRAWLAQHELVEGKADDTLLSMLTSRIEGNGSPGKFFRTRSIKAYRDISVKGFDVLYHFENSGSGTYEPIPFGPRDGYAFRREGTILTVWRIGMQDQPLVFDLKKVGGELKPGDNTPTRKQMTLETQNDVLRVRLTVEGMRGELYPDGGTPTVNWVEGFILAVPKG